MAFLWLLKSLAWFKGTTWANKKKTNPPIQSYAHPLGCLNLSRNFRTSRFDPEVCRALLVCKGRRQHPLLDLKRGNILANILKMQPLYYIIKLKSWYYLPMFICGVQIQVTNSQGCKWWCPVPSTPWILSKQNQDCPDNRLGQKLM